jgi:hypothetical protein
MKYQKLNHFSDSEFKRLVGVPHKFLLKLDVLEKQNHSKRNQAVLIF